MLFFLGNNRYSHNILIRLYQIYINSNNMANLNRIKVVLVEKIKLANGSQTSWANRHAQLVNGAKTQYNRI